MDDGLAFSHHTLSGKKQIIIQQKLRRKTLPMKFDPADVKQKKQEKIKFKRYLHHLSQGTSLPQGQSLLQGQGFFPRDKPPPGDKSFPGTSLLQGQGYGLLQIHDLL